jgi:YcxB-like protein
LNDEGAAAGEREITGSLELEERDFRRAIVELSWVLRARSGVGVVLVGIYGAVILLGHRSIHQMIEPLVVSGLLMGTLFFSPYVRARQSLAALAALAGGDKQASYRFDDDSVTIRMAGATSTIAYRSLMSYREGETELLLVSAPGVAHIVPKRAFSAGDASRITALLAANVKARRLPLSP